MRCLPMRQQQSCCRHAAQPYIPLWGPYIPSIDRKWMFRQIGSGYHYCQLVHGPLANFPHTKNSVLAVTTRRLELVPLFSCQPSFFLLTFLLVLFFLFSSTSSLLLVLFYFFFYSFSLLPSTLFCSFPVNLPFFLLLFFFFYFFLFSALLLSFFFFSLVSFTFSFLS